MIIFVTVCDTVVTDLKPMDMEKKLVEFLISRPEISISGVEKQAGMPRRTLKYSIDGTRRIPEKYVRGLVSVLSGYGFDVSGYEAEVCANVAERGFVTSDTIVDSVSVDVNTGEVSQKKNAKVPPVKQKEVVTNGDLSQNVTGRTSHGYPMPDPIRLNRAKILLLELENKMGIEHYNDVDMSDQAVRTVNVTSTAVVTYKPAVTKVPDGMVECYWIGNRIQRAVRHMSVFGYWDSYEVVYVPDETEVLVDKDIGGGKTEREWHTVRRGVIGRMEIGGGGKSVFYRVIAKDGTVVYVPVEVFVQD